MLAWVSSLAEGGSRTPPRLGENTPVDPSTIAAEIAQMKKEYEAFWASVNGTLRSTTSYDNDPAFKPCSNPASGCCRLAGQAPTPPPPAPPPRGK